MWYFRFQAVSNLFGLPDIIILYLGKFIGVELKTRTGVATELQLRKLLTINENGGIGVIIRSVRELDLLLDFVEDGGHSAYEFERLSKTNPR